MLEINTLGGLSLGVNGQAIQDLGSRKAEAILVYLVREGRQLNRNILKILFWPESSEEHASTSLRVELSILRKRLGGFLAISREMIGVRPDARVYLDLADLNCQAGKQPGGTGFGDLSRGLYAGFSPP